MPESCRLHYVLMPCACECDLIWEKVSTDVIFMAKPFRSLLHTHIHTRMHMCKYRLMYIYGHTHVNMHEIPYRYICI